MGKASVGHIPRDRLPEMNRIQLGLALRNEGCSGPGFSARSRATHLRRRTIHG